MKPTQEQVIQMAREAGASVYTNRGDLSRPFHTFSPEQLECFCALVRNQALEDAANECEDTQEEFDQYTGQSTSSLNYTCAKVIRKMKEPTP